MCTLWDRETERKNGEGQFKLRFFWHNYGDVSILSIAEFV